MITNAERHCAVSVSIFGQAIFYAIWLKSENLCLLPYSPLVASNTDTCPNNVESMAKLFADKCRCYPSLRMGRQTWKLTELHHEEREEHEGNKERMLTSGIFLRALRVLLSVCRHSSCYQGCQRRVERLTGTDERVINSIVCTAAANGGQEIIECLQVAFS